MMTVTTVVAEVPVLSPRKRQVRREVLKRDALSPRDRSKGKGVVERTRDKTKDRLESLSSGIKKLRSRASKLEEENRKMMDSLKVLHKVLLRGQDDKAANLLLGVPSSITAEDRTRQEALDLAGSLSTLSVKH